MRIGYPVGAGKRLARFSLLLGLVAALTLWSGASVTHAAPATPVTITIGTCDATTLNNAIANAASGDTITFACDGDILLTHTLTIGKYLTLDGSGGHVTLDGGSKVQVLSVSPRISFTLNALTIAHGSGDEGGAIFNDFGTVTISNSTIANNVGSFGGGIDNFGGTVTISNSTIANNRSSYFGGGLRNDGGTVTISNSTIANNHADAGAGGAFSNVTSTSGGTITIGGSVVANNTVINPIVSGNLMSNCGGGVSDQGYNLDSGTTCGFTTASSGGTSLSDTDPKLASALAYNGGPTQTLALRDGSPAINKIPAGSRLCPAADQRGLARAQGPACDIGAFEFRVPVLGALPSMIRADATGPGGAPVTYDMPTASEPDDASATPSVTCAPASGSTFPIGTTTVTCTASDAATPPDVASGSFQVTIAGASEQLSDLQNQVDGIRLAHGPQTSFDNQLNAVQADLAAGNTGQACGDLQAFINHVKAQSGKQLTTAKASQLLAAAAQIQTVIGC